MDGEGLEAYAFLFPAMLVLVVFLLLPAGWIVWLSFTRWDLIAQNPDFVGLANYERLFERDELFRRALVQTVYFVVVTVPVGMALGLFLAVVLNEKMPGRDLIRGAVFAPYVMPLVATVLIWGFMFNADFGVLNAFLHLFGVPKLKWLDDPATVMPAIILFSIWQHTGYNTVIFLAGLANLAPDLAEAAAVAGHRPDSAVRRGTVHRLTPHT